MPYLAYFRQKIQTKKEINWSFHESNFANCSTVILNFRKWDYYNPDTISEHFKEIYLTINLLNTGYNFKEKNYNILTNGNLSIYECNVSSL